MKALIPSKSLSLALVVLFTSCAKQPSIHTERFIQAEFEEVVAEFEAEYGVRVNYPVTYGNVSKWSSNPYVKGVCVRSGGKPVEIVVKPDVVDPDALWLVLFHELAHCSLGLEHYEDPNDIMNDTYTTLLNRIERGLETRDGAVIRLNERIGKGVRRAE